MNKNYYGTTHQIVLASISITLILVSKLIFYQFPIIFGYPLDIYLIFYTIGFVLLSNRTIRLIYSLIVPAIILIIPDWFFIHPTQFFSEYFLGLWIFNLCFFSREILELNTKNKKFKYAIVVLLFIVSWILKLLIHVVIGKFYWVDSWIGSLLINSRIIGINSLINVIVFVPILPILNKSFVE